MPNVLIRNVDPAVHAILTARAAAAGQSLQEYLRTELARLAGRPTLAELLDRIERRVAGERGEPTEPFDSVAAIHAARDERDRQITDAQRSQDDDRR